MRCAYANVQNNESFNVVLGGLGGGVGGSLGGLNTSTDRGGWVIGGGVEIHLWYNWTAKLEVLYMDLNGSENGGMPFVETFSNSATKQIVKVGLNYKVGP
jgi:opacity protein-like surface antigen